MCIRDSCGDGRVYQTLARLSPEINHVLVRTRQRLARAPPTPEDGQTNRYPEDGQTNRYQARAAECHNELKRQTERLRIARRSSCAFPRVYSRNSATRITVTMHDLVFAHLSIHELHSMNCCTLMDTMAHTHTHTRSDVYAIMIWEHIIRITSWIGQWMVWY